MKKKIVLLVLLAVLVAVRVVAGDDVKLKEAVSGDHRESSNAARDAHRHPYETLSFFGIKDSMTVVEVWPSTGWYTEILAPYLKDNGKLIPAQYDRNAETQKPWMARVNKVWDEKYGANPDVYGAMTPVSLVIPGENTIAPDGSVDMILDFRNAHNWIQWGADDMVKAWHKALKKGGVVGIVDHRKADDQPYNADDGYLHEKQLIELMEKHGFKLDARSDINANAKDTQNHPQGVWSLPPTYAGGDTDKAKFTDIGESNRMTLRFVKI